MYMYSMCSMSSAQCAQYVQYVKHVHWICLICIWRKRIGNIKVQHKNELGPGTKKKENIFQLPRNSENVGKFIVWCLVQPKPETICQDGFVWSFGVHTMTTNSSEIRSYHGVWSQFYRIPQDDFEGSRWQIQISPMLSISRWSRWLAAQREICSLKQETFVL